MDTSSQYGIKVMVGRRTLWTKATLPRPGYKASKTMLRWGAELPNSDRQYDEGHCDLVEGAGQYKLAWKVVVSTGVLYNSSKAAQ